MQNRRQLRFVTVLTKPFGRALDLDHKDGVKTWSVRLGPGETNIWVGNVRFSSSNHGEGGESSDEEDNKDKEKEKEKEKDKRKEKDSEKVPGTESAQQREEEEEPEEAQAQLQTKPKRPRGRPRKRTRKPVPEPNSKDKGKDKAPNGPLEDEVQLKCNGTVVQPLEDEKETWEVNLVVGMNVIEVGEAGGVVWRMYLERTAAA